MTFSSLLFIAALGLVNADGNITSYNLTNDPHNYGESNQILAPVAKGDTRYLYWAPVTAGLIVGHDNLKAIDPALADLETVGIITAEYFSIRSWSYSKADIGWEIGLSEVEFLVTSSALNIKF